MAEELEKLREEPKEKAPGGNKEQPIPKEDNRSFNFVFEFRKEEPDKTVVEFRCSGNGFTDSDWKDLSETTVKEGCMAVKKSIRSLRTSSGWCAAKRISSCRIALLYEGKFHLFDG